jgi:hypothetical protein
MLRITIELLPHGSEAKKRYLGTIEIANTGGTPTRGNYRVRLSKRDKPNQVWKEAQIANFPRRRLGAYDLLYRALAAVVGERNGKEPSNDQTQR